MKDSLKDFIDANKGAFDGKEPSPETWDRIAASLPKMQQVSIWNNVTLWRAAAILFMSFSIYLFLSKPPVERDDQANLLKGEFSDIELFYSNEIAKKVALIDHFDGGFSKDQFTQDFQKLDAMYQILRDEMKSRPSEKVKDALILNILVRVDLLNQQIKKLEESKEKKAVASPTSV